MKPRILTALVVLPLLAAPARAEKQEISIVGQYGLSYLPVMLMEHEKVVEKRAREAGLGDVKVTWDANAGPAGANDMLISGQRDIVGVGLPSLVTLWARTKGTPTEVKALSAMQALPFYLMSRNPAVKTIRDFTEKDRIAVPSVKISVQAIMLQMAAAKEWGIENYQKLDPLTVSMAHPDAAAAVLSGKSEVNAHFTVAPFQSMEAADPAVHQVISSFDIAGRHTGGVLVARTQFARDNPKLFAAFLAAQQDINRFIKERPRDAAAIYIKMSNNKRQTVEEVEKEIAAPDVEYTTTPVGVMVQAKFMQDTGRVKDVPASWKEYFFPNVHDQPGS
jgi:NitT/TauT family transport system substrate-binding protein